MKERNSGRKATTRAARAASTKDIRAAVAREARRRGISPAELIRRSSEAHKRMSARGKDYHAPIMDAAPTTTAKEQREHERVARWRQHIEKHLAKIGNNPQAREGLELIEAAADVSGMTPTEFLVDAMKREHGLTDRQTLEAVSKRERDEQTEEWPTRERNAYEKEKTRDVVFAFYLSHPRGLEHAEVVEMIRLFFRPGDRSLADAEERAIREALKTRTANRNCGHTRRERVKNGSSPKTVEVKYPAHIVKAAAREAGTPPAEYVAKTHTFNAGRPMSARYVKTEKGVAAFIVEPTK